MSISADANSYVNDVSIIDYLNDSTIYRLETETNLTYHGAFLVKSTPRDLDIGPWVYNEKFLNVLFIRVQLNWHGL